MKPRRLRRFVLIVGTTLSVLIVVAFVLSAWWAFALQAPTQYGPVMVVRDGGVVVSLMRLMDEWVYVERSVGRHMAWWNYWSVLQVGGPPREVRLPLYAVFAAVAIPTLLVWWFGRKRVKPGACACGYDLTGNVSGRCPECGTATGAV